MAMFNHDEKHRFSLVAGASDAASTPRPQQCSIQGESVRSAPSENTFASYIHENVVCDACDQTIVGSRHKCLNCFSKHQTSDHGNHFHLQRHVDFDLCDECYPTASLTHSQHDFMKITDPSAISIHRVRGSGPAPRRLRPGLRVSSRDAPSDLLHQAICDLCDSRIRGFRYVSASK